MRAVVLGSAMSTLSGVALAAATRSATELPANDGLAASTIGSLPTRMIGAKSLAGIESQRGIHELVHALGGIGAHHQRVSVGVRTRRLLGADIAAGARLVLDIEALAHRPRQLLGEISRHHVGALARLIRRR